MKEAIDFLTDLLKDRSVSVKKIKTLVHQSGHYQTILKRAKERIGIKYKKESFLGNWVWVLPKEMNSLHLLIHKWMSKMGYLMKFIFLLLKRSQLMFKDLLQRVVPSLAQFRENRLKENIKKRESKFTHK